MITQFRLLIPETRYGSYVYGGLGYYKSLATPALIPVAVGSGRSTLRPVAV